MTRPTGEASAYNASGRDLGSVLEGLRAALIRPYTRFDSLTSHSPLEGLDLILMLLILAAPVPPEKPPNIVPGKYIARHYGIMGQAWFFPNGQYVFLSDNNSHYDGWWEYDRRTGELRITEIYLGAVGSRHSTGTFVMKYGNQNKSVCMCADCKQHCLYDSMGYRILRKEYDLTRKRPR